MRARKLDPQLLVPRLAVSLLPRAFRTVPECVAFAPTPIAEENSLRLTAIGKTMSFFVAIPTQQRALSLSLLGIPWFLFRLSLVDSRLYRILLLTIACCQQLLILANLFLLMRFMPAMTRKISRSSELFVVSLLELGADRADLLGQMFYLLRPVFFLILILLLFRTRTPVSACIVLVLLPTVYYIHSAKFLPAQIVPLRALLIARCSEARFQQGIVRQSGSTLVIEQRTRVIKAIADLYHCLDGLRPRRRQDICIVRMHVLFQNEKFLLLCHRRFHKTEKCRNVPVVLLETFIQALESAHRLHAQQLTVVAWQVFLSNSELEVLPGIQLSFVERSSVPVQRVIL